jgi:hypothetical protein
MENGVLLRYFLKITDFIKKRPVNLAGRKTAPFSGGG